MRVILLVIAGLIGLAGAGFAGIYLRSEAMLRDVPERVAFDVSLPKGADAIAQGRHVARTRGCFGCHGQDLQGKDFGEQWDWPDRAVAPNLAAYAREHDAATIEAAVRQGIGQDGKALMSMPSYNFARLSDADMAALIAFLQSAPIIENPLPRARLGWGPRLALITGEEPHMAELAGLVPQLSVDAAAEPQRAAGEYLAMTMCNECHGFDVRGQSYWPPPTPDLMLVAAYSREDFATLIRTGTSGGRELGLMSLVAPDRFPDLSENEIDALYAYLSSLIDEPVAEDVFWRPAGGAE
ncbi:MAG: c-type cytochrome [Hyphomonas sp.]|nr:c-type cytochrome [Hyphomonas sp.]